MAETTYALPGRRGVLATLLLGAAMRPAAAEWLRDEVVVYADPALRPVLNAVAADYPATLRVFCAPPAQMLGLLAHGTQDDVLITLPRFIAQAQQSGLVAATSRPLWRNQLAFAAPGAGGSPRPFDEAALLAALDGGKLAVPDPNPAATFNAAAVLQRLGLTEKLAGRIQGAAGTADALGMLHTGDAVMALCHVSEIHGDQAASVAMQVPQTAFDPIEYAAVLSKQAWSRNQNALLAWLPAAPEAARFGLETLT